MTRPKTYDWLRAPGETIAHAVRHGQRAAVCDEATSSSWIRTEGSSGWVKCATCLPIASPKHNPNSNLPPDRRPDIEGSRLIGGEYRDYLDALVLAHGAGGVKATVIGDGVRAWLFKHRLALPASVSGDPANVRWQITELGRKAAERGFY